MTTVLKIEGGQLKAKAAEALEPHIETVWATPGKRLVVIGELQRMERTEPDPDADRKPSVLMRLAQLEVADGDQEHPVRNAMRALYLQRTADGTLTADGDVELSENTLTQCAGILSSIEAAKLRTVVKAYADRARAATMDDLGLDRLRAELAAIRDGLTDALGAITEFDEGDDDDGPAS